MQALQDHERQNALRAAKHEFGHYIVATVNGFHATDVMVKLIFKPMFQQGHEGNATIELNMAAPDLDGVEKYIERRVQVLFGGSLAEALGHGTGRIDEKLALEYLNTNGKSDFDKSRELMNLLRCIRHGPETNQTRADAQLQAICDGLWNKAGEIVQAEHEMIEGFASRLAQKVNAINEPTVLTESDIKSTDGWIKRFGPRGLVTA